MLESIIVPAIVAVLTAFVTAFGAFMIQKKRWRRDFELDIERVRTEFMAEQVAKKLLESERWEKRSFEAIKRRLGGFEDNELRRILVRAGAVRFEGDESQELWGLLSKNKNAL